jgi:hypothetical protein
VVVAKVELYLLNPGCKSACVRRSAKCRVNIVYVLPLTIFLEDKGAGTVQGIPVAIKYKKIARNAIS